MPYEGERRATIQELQARGLAPANPMVPGPVDPATPTLNEQAIRDRTTEAVRRELPGFEVRPGIRQVPPGTPTIPMPTAGQYIAGNLKREAPNIAGMVGATVAPGSGIMGFLSRLGLGSAAAGAAGAATSREPLREAGKFAVGQAGGEALAGAGRLVGANVARSAYAKEAAGDIASLLKKHIPALAKFGNDAKALHQMVYGTEGQAAVRAEFDKALKAGVDKAREQGLRIPMRYEDAAKLGLLKDEFGKVRPDYMNLPGAKVTLPSMSAAEAAEKVLGWWKKDPALYNRVIEELDRVGVGAPEARAAYKYYMGFSQYADKTKMLAGEQYWPERAMGGKGGDLTGGLSDLRTVAELRRRGMDDMVQALRGPGAKPMSRSTIPWWTRHGVTAALGEAGAHAMGLPPLVGGTAGWGLGSAVPRSVYHNAPLTQGVQSGLRGGAVGLGQIGREYMHTVSSS